MKFAGHTSKAAVLGCVLALFLLAILPTGFASPQEMYSIRIESDGTITPSTVPIQRSGDIYTLTGDICGTVVIDRSNVVLDGAGYSLYGDYNGTRTDDWVVGEGPNQEVNNESSWTIGIDFGVERRPNNLTVRSLNVRNFYIGMYVWTSNNTITGNSVADNIVGILLSGDYNTITSNYIARNEQGIFFGVNTPGNEPLNIVLTHNSLVDNDIQFSGCFCEEYNTEELVHTWDDGKEGNYWSDYDGVDGDGDGIGDSPYTIDVLNEDRFPLMQIRAAPPTPALASRAPVGLILLALILTGILVASLIAYRRRKASSAS